MKNFDADTKIYVHSHSAVSKDR